jgi:hypothetical protein
LQALDYQHDQLAFGAGGWTYCGHALAYREVVAGTHLRQ